MSFIKFELKNYDEIALWGDKEHGYYLHWFGLTDSYYWLNFNGAEILKYTDDVIKENIGNTRLPYIDYQFSRIYEDLLDILINILIPIPDAVFDLVNNPNGVINYRNFLNAWLDKVIVDEEKDYDYEYDELYFPAINWLNARSLDLGYLVGAPEVYFLRNNYKVYIQWYCENKCTDGYDMWEAKNGCCAMNVDYFINDIFDAFDAFIGKMDNRVNEIVNKLPYSEVSIDLNMLNKEHEIRKHNLSSMKIKVEDEQRSSEFNWNEIIEAIRKLKEM